ncbi:MAG: amino acid permease [Candidatus Woesearchaeota archaeon]|jgi:amino acid transporter|nr:amino acid permease [Candidatus Woesearchaeota archaeon]|tara:strand:- start:679 stop:2583 length:1905 start_codon:yes stop_codon:yes gene_type:complete
MAELKRALGFGTILSLSIASIMGTGMFFGAAVGASYSGNASIIAWVILTIVAVYISAFFGELVAMFPRAGGVYEFAKQAYSHFTSFMMGWLAWLLGNLLTALMIVAAIDYIIPDPSQFFLKMVISVSLIVLLNIIAFYGIEASGFVVVVLAIFSIVLVLAVIFPGIFFMDMNNLTPFLAVGIAPILVTIFFLAESFFGWESATYLAEETKEPEKTIPKALVYGTIIIGVLTTGISLISLGIIPWKALIESSAPLSLVFERIYGAFGNALNYGVFIALIGSAAGGIITMPRLILALARDKLFIAQLSEIHPKYKTPYKAIIFQTIVTLIIFGMAFGKYKTLLSLALPLALIMYIFVILAVPILRRKLPDIKRSFKAPFAKIGSVLIVLFFLSLIIVWLMQEENAFQILRLGLSFVAIGIPIYMLLEIYYNPDFIIRVNDALAYLTLLTERIILPKHVRKEILTLLGNIQNKTVLEFGCSVGTLTLNLAENVKPTGKVYATDFSKKDLIITRNRMKKRGHHHVIVIHDEHQVNRIHPNIPSVDTIVSVGMMGYMQDVKKILREMRELMPYGGKIVFVDYADFFKMIPNVAWLSKDSTIEKLFREAGFSVFVTRKKGLFWNYIYVHGIKFRKDVPYV